MTDTLGIKYYSIRHIYAIAANINHIFKAIVILISLMKIKTPLGNTALTITEPIAIKHTNANSNRK